MVISQGLRRTRSWPIALTDVPTRVLQPLQSCLEVRVLERRTTHLFGLNCHELTFAIVVHKRAPLLASLWRNDRDGHACRP